MSDDAPRTRLIRIPPFHYLHVLDRNSNVTRLEVGPQTFVCREHERVVFGPEKMIIVPPRHYCIIANPVIRENIEIDYSSLQKKLGKTEENSSDDILDVIKHLESNKGPVVLDRFGQAKLRHADREMRFEQNEPFPLYPGEQLIGSMIPLTVVKPNSALRLKSNRDFTDRYLSITQGKIISRYKAGDEWLFEGPATYIPQVEIDVIETVNAVIVKPGCALKLSAKSSFIDRNGVARKSKLRFNSVVLTVGTAGEQWLMRGEGAYLPGVHETVINSVSPIVLTEKKALHLKAARTFTDVFGVKRNAGEEWLVTYKDKETHIVDVNEVLVQQVVLTSLGQREYCIINNPLDENGEPQYGAQKLVRGEANFFLQPGEELDPRGIQNVYVLGEEEALYVTCSETFEEKIKNGKMVKRIAGQKWLVYGPMEYLPPLQVTVLGTRKALLQIESLNFYALYWS